MDVINEDINGEIYMKAKSSIITLVLIICLVLSAVIGYKKGYIGDIFNLKTKKLLIM